MNEEQLREMLMKVIDGVASEDEKAELEKSIEADEKLRDEYNAMKRIKEVTDSMQFKELPDSYWTGYWGGIYNKLERGIGWILLSIGVVVVLAFVLYHLFSDFFLNPAQPIVLRVGIFFGGIGIITLLWSVLREKLFARRHERYKEVER